MKNANISDAKTHLSKLIKSVLAGEDVIISRRGKPVVRLIPYWWASKPRTPGAWKGCITISDDFDDESKEINAMFYWGIRMRFLLDIHILLWWLEDNPKLPWNIQRNYSES